LIYADREFGPGLHAVGADFTVDPHTDYGLEHLLKGLKLFVISIGLLKCLMQLADPIAAFEQAGQAAL